MVFWYQQFLKTGDVIEELNGVLVNTSGKEATTRFSPTVGEKIQTHNQKQVINKDIDNIQYNSSSSKLHSLTKSWYGYHQQHQLNCRQAVFILGLLGGTSPPPS